MGGRARAYALEGKKTVFQGKGHMISHDGDGEQRRRSGPGMVERRAVIEMGWR